MRAVAWSYPTNPLKPGDSYEVGIFEKDYGPLSAQPWRHAYLKVFCLRKKPERRDFILPETDKGSGTFGGTYYERAVYTKALTSIVKVGVSREPPFDDEDGIPRLKDAVGPSRDNPILITPLGPDLIQHVRLSRLLPGKHYFFLVLVADRFGNWDVRRGEFDTLRRKLTVEFSELDLINDGDPLAAGNVEFWFEVYEGARTSENMVAGFHQPNGPLDDEFPAPFIPKNHDGTPCIYRGEPKPIEDGKWPVSVYSKGLERDGDGIFDLLEPDEWAGMVEVGLDFPVGPGEKVTNRQFTLDCTSVDGSDFHYKVEGLWSVEYVP